MDLTEAYKFLAYDLIAKIADSGFDNMALALITVYLTNRLQQVKTVSSFSSYLEILIGILQGSILGPIFFIVFINDFMLFIEEIEVCNFPDDTAIYSSSLNYEEAYRNLSNDTHIVLNCLSIVW